MTRRSVALVSDYALNPYLARLGDELSERYVVEIGVPSLRRVVLGLGRNLPDVVHLHWEGHWLARSPRRRAFVGFAKLMTLILLAHRGRRRIVWTVHNLVSHDSAHPVLERALQIILSRVVHVITIHHESGRREAADHLALDVGRIAVVHHASYQSPRMLHSKAPCQTGSPVRFAVIGLVRPYKRIDQIVRTVSGSGHLHLVVAGPVTDSDYERQVRSAAAGVGNVELRLSHQTDEEIEALLHESDFMIVGAVGQLTSGSAILAGSHGVPVLAEPTSFLDDTFGPYYVAADPTDPAALDHAASLARGSDFDDLREAALLCATRYSFSDMADAYSMLYETEVPRRSVT